MGWPAAASAQRGLTRSCVLLMWYQQSRYTSPWCTRGTSRQHKGRHTAIWVSDGQSQCWLVEQQPLCVFIEIIKSVLSRVAGGTRKCVSVTYVRSVHPFTCTVKLSYGYSSSRLFNWTHVPVLVFKYGGRSDYTAFNIFKCSGWL